MRQPNQRGKALLNTNPKWPEGYVAVLREVGALEKTIPFLVTWVRRFFARFPGRSRRDLGRIEIETFLSEVTRRTEISNWEIAQARDALELYYEQFRGIALAPRPDHVLPTTPSPTPSVQPSREKDKPLVPNGHSVHNEPTFKPSTPYQAQRLPVKAFVRNNIGQGKALSAPSALTKDVPGPVVVTGKTNWPLLEARVREYLREMTRTGMCHFPRNIAKKCSSGSGSGRSSIRSTKRTTCTRWKCPALWRRNIRTRPGSGVGSMSLRRTIFRRIPGRDIFGGIMWTSNISSVPFAMRFARRG